VLRGRRHVEGKDTVVGSSPLLVRSAASGASLRLIG
jgi:hypothetical protein